MGDDVADIPTAIALFQLGVAPPRETIAAITAASACLAGTDVRQVLLRSLIASAVEETVHATTETAETWRLVHTVINRLDPAVRPDSGAILHAVTRGRLYALGYLAGRASRH